MAVSLAVVGAISSSTDWDSPEAAAGATPATQLRSAVHQPESAILNVPIRSGRLSDEEVEADRPRPVAVRMAGIALEADVIPVGVDNDNQFAVPAADTVGWYQFGSAPGEAGASVLAAHVDYAGRPGAFFNLREVVPGDRLEVELEDGSVVQYQVTGNTVYDKTHLPAEELFRKQGTPVLQLITCGGTFDPQARSYEANVVVTAVPLAA